jgi:hypothetical protein
MGIERSGNSKGEKMTLLIRGVYRDGVFHPVEPVALENNTFVTMTVDAKSPAVPAEQESEAARERREIHEVLVKAGVVHPGPVPGPVQSPLSPEREAEIAHKLAEIGPVYDIIREERDGN